MQSVTVAVVQDGEVLLTKREDFEVWCLPGGEVEAGETLPQAAMRETQEETGLEVRLTRLIGVYSRMGFLGGIHSLVFAAEPIGGALQLQPGETVDVGWFGLEAVPELLLPWHRQPIEAALQETGWGMAWRLHMSSPLSEQIQTRQDLYDLRDQSGLTRPEFFRQMMDTISVDEQVEVGEGRTRGE